MIAKFSVANYLSFKEKQSISFEATSMKEHQLDNVATSGNPKINLLKSSVLFGWNSSGKSNYIKAIACMRDMVLNSFTNVNYSDKLNVISYKLNTSCESMPSVFEIEFFIEGIKYLYNIKLTEDEVVEEKLHYIKVNKALLIFSRVREEYKYGKAGADLEKVEPFTRNNTLFISTASQFNMKLPGEIVKWFDSINILFAAEDISLNVTAECVNDNEYIKYFPKLFEKMQLGFTGLLADLKEDGNLELLAVHDKFDDEGNKVGSVNFKLNERESLGTRKIIALSGYFIKALADGKILIIDELDARIHPGLVRSLIKLFNSSEHNLKGAQLIISSHNTAILNKELFRRDQINIIEKSLTGDSVIWSLAETGIRNDASYDMVYLKNKYSKYRALIDTMDINLLD